MTGIRHSDVKDFWKKSCLFTPSHLAVTAPVGHAAPLRYAGTFTASVSLTETSLTLRCGPEWPCRRNPVCPPPVTCGDSPGGACGSASLRRHLHCFGFIRKPR